jgi:hypothetical protein
VEEEREGKGAKATEVVQREGNEADVVLVD